VHSSFVKRVLMACTASALACACLGTAGVAGAEDDAPPGPGSGAPKGCSIFSGGPETHTTGGVFTFPPGYPVPGGGTAGTYVCIDGRWVFIAPVIGPGGPISMEGAPTLAVDDGTVTVAEATTATNQGTVTFDGEAAVVLSTSTGTVTDTGGGTWSWSYTPTDGPAQSQSVSVFSSADGRVSEVRFDLVVENVPPTITSIAASVASTLVGQPVAFNATASDPSIDDTAGGFSWTFDGVSSEGSSITMSFPSCGLHVVTAVAEDKDGGESAAVTSTAVDVAEARLLAPLTAGAHNVVRAGQVVPVRVAIGCGSDVMSGLAPTLSVLSGDLDPLTDADDPTVVVPVTDAAGVDTSGVLRAVAGGYVYDLRVPTAPAGSMFTIRVRPFDGSPAALVAVLTIRR
jgi:hypothetical protein